jgi:hypothetical protein
MFLCKNRQRRNVAIHPHREDILSPFGRSDSRWHSIEEHRIHVNKSPIVGSELHFLPQNQMRLTFENGLCFPAADRSI